MSKKKQTKQNENPIEVNQSPHQNRRFLHEMIEATHPCLNTLAPQLCLETPPQFQTEHAWALGLLHKNLDPSNATHCQNTHSLSPTWPLPCCYSRTFHFLKFCCRAPRSYDDYSTSYSYGHLAPEMLLVDTLTLKQIQKGGGHAKPWKTLVIPNQFIIIYDNLCLFDSEAYQKGKNKKEIVIIKLSVMREEAKLSVMRLDNFTLMFVSSAPLGPNLCLMWMLHESQINNEHGGPPARRPRGNLSAKQGWKSSIWGKVSRE